MLVLSNVSQCYRFDFLVIEGATLAFIVELASDSGTLMTGDIIEQS
jgi:hypothetical protein